MRELGSNEASRHKLDQPPCAAIHSRLEFIFGPDIRSLQAPLCLHFHTRVSKRTNKRGGGQAVDTYAPRVHWLGL